MKQEYYMTHLMSFDTSFCDTAVAKYVHHRKAAQKWRGALNHRVPNPTPPSSTQGKAGRNHLNEEITPLLPKGIGEQYSQTISNLGHSALLRRCELPL
jgi:hypothetical protein